MCLAIPARILEREGDRAVVDRDGLQLEIDLSLLPEAKAGDFVVVHVGIGLSLLDPEETRATLEAHAAKEEADRA